VSQQAMSHTSMLSGVIPRKQEIRELIHEITKPP
jgi:hypothetical protein